MATARSKLCSAEDTLLLWQAIEALEGYELQNLLTNELLAETDRPKRFTGSSRLELVRELVARGADVNAVRADGFTPLLLSVFFGHLDVVKLLLEHGADLTVRTRFGTSAEMWAHARGFYDIADYLQACRDESVSFSDSAFEDVEWFGESLVTAGPEIEEPLSCEAATELTEECFEPTIRSTSLEGSELDDDETPMQAAMEDSSTRENSAPASEEQSAIPAPSLEDDEVTLFRPVMQESPTSETSAALYDECLESPIPAASLEDDEVSLVNLTIRSAPLENNEPDHEMTLAQPAMEESPSYETSGELYDEYIEPTATPAPSLEDDEVTVVRPRTSPTASFESSHHDNETTTATPVFAKLLKDPPEIWDLVHENRNNFNARSAFLSHVSSIRARTALLTLVILVIAAVIAFAAMGLHDRKTATAVESRNIDPVVQPEKPKEQTTTASNTEPQPQDAAKQRIDVTQGAEPGTVASTQTVGDNNQTRSASQNRRARSSTSTPSSAAEISNDTGTEKVPTKTETKQVQPVQTVTVTATLKGEVAAKKTPNTNNKLIQNSSASQPRKPRVIQWP